MNLFAALCTGVLAAMVPFAGGPVAPDERPRTTQADADVRGWVLAGDARSRKVLLLDGEPSTWDPDQQPDALKWSWKPTAENGFGDVLDGWEADGAITDARRRTGGPEGDLVLVTTEMGFMGAVSYPSGERIWAADAGVCGDGECGPHAAEILPDGNIAVAGSTGKFVRIYKASQGPAVDDYVQYDLPSAHGVLWDPEREVLWALGYFELVALRIGGTPDNPTIEKVHSATVPRTEPGGQGGHELSPVFGDTDKLFVTTNDLAYVYSKSADEFTTEFPHAEKINANRLTKSLGNHPDTGQLILTHAKKYDCPDETWCTPTVEFHGDDATRTLPEAKFYKARWWAPDYQ